MKKQKIKLPPINILKESAEERKKRVQQQKPMGTKVEKDKRNTIENKNIKGVGKTMSKNVLIVMCGLPASGKSTYSQWLAESGVFERVCPDLIRKELYGDENIQGDGKQVFALAHFRVAQLGSICENVVFDATNINRKRRTELVKQMRPYFDIIICKWFHTPYDICYQRNQERARQVPTEVLYRMFMNFEEPTKDEGWDLIEEIKNY